MYFPHLLILIANLIALWTKNIKSILSDLVILLFLILKDAHDILLRENVTMLKIIAWGRKSKLMLEGRKNEGIQAKYSSTK